MRILFKFKHTSADYRIISGLQLFDKSRGYQHLKKTKDLTFNYSEVEFGSTRDLEYVSARTTLTRGKPNPPEAPLWAPDNVLVNLFGAKDFEKFCKSAWGVKPFVFECKDDKLLAKYFNVDRLKKSLFTNGEGMMLKADKKDAGLDALAHAFYEWTQLQTTIDLYAYSVKTLRNAQGDWHWDSQDKFLFCLEGSGTLEIYEPIGPLILPEQNFRNILHLGIEDTKLVKKIKKQPGDIIYIPRGVPHRHIFDASSPAMHAPVWLKPITIHRLWSRLTLHALAVCESEIQFRQAVDLNDVQNLASKKSIRALMKLFERNIDKNLIEYFWNEEHVRQQHLAFDAEASAKQSRKRLKAQPAQSYFKRTYTKYDLNNYFGVWELILPHIKIYLTARDKIIFSRLVRLDQFQLQDLKKLKLSKESIQNIVKLLIDHDLFRVEIKAKSIKIKTL